MIIEMLTAGVITAGSGRGFVVEGVGERLVITAAHCLPFLPPAQSFFEPKERIFGPLIARLGDQPHAWGWSPRRAMSGPKMRSLGSKKDWAGGRNGRQCAAVMTRRSPAPSTTKPRPLPAVMTPAVSISIIMVFCF